MQLNTAMATMLLNVFNIVIFLMWIRRAWFGNGVDYSHLSIFQNFSMVVVVVSSFFAIEAFMSLE